MTLGFYFIIAAICAAPGVALWLLSLLLLFVEWNMTYIDERRFRWPKIIVAMYNSLAKSFGDSEIKYELFEDNDYGNFSAMILMPSIFGGLFWPVTGIGCVYYTMLRMLRFSFRLKKGLMKLVNGKKCLAEYTEADKPKLNF